MIKFGCNQAQIMEGVSGNADPNVNTPQISTADTSVLTNKISTFFATQNQFSKPQN
jgi:hypothetical protein